MTILNIEVYVGQLWDWSILDGCFGATKIKASDIDGIVERCGYFLVLETKMLGVPLNLGQHLTFDALLDTGLFTVIQIRGARNDVKELTVCHREARLHINQASNDDLRNFVAWWFDHARNRSFPVITTDGELRAAFDRWCGHAESRTFPRRVSA